jgi:hypothetical protein
VPWRFALGLGIFSFVLLTTDSARSEIDGERFRSKEWRIRMTAPKDWQISEQTSYPNILLWMVRANPAAKMLLSAEHHREAIDALEYALRTSKVLEQMGFQVRPPQLHAATGAYLIDFDNCDEPARGCVGRVFLRQAFLVVDGVGYALTLATPDLRTRGRHLHVFDSALRSIRIQRSAEAAPPAREMAGP